MKEKILDDPTQDAKLKALIAYCKAHPDQRFWQAIRNTSKYSFIYGCNNDPKSLALISHGQLTDTFYL